MDIVSIYEWISNNPGKAQRLYATIGSSEITQVSERLRNTGATTVEDAYHLLVKDIAYNPYVELAKRKIVDLIYKEAKLEGIAVTYPQTEQLYAGRTVAGLTIEDTVKINNMKHAWQFILDTLDAPIDLSYISQVNFFVEQGLRVDCGKLRIQPVSIGGTNWYPDIPDRDMVAVEIDSIIAKEDALHLCAYLMRSQLFSDGNKRTAQLVANKWLISSKSGILSVPVERLEEFFTVLIDFYETNIYESIIRFLKSCITGI